MNSIYREIQAERERQNRLKAEGRFPYTCADIELSETEKLAVLAEEVGEVSHEVTEYFMADIRDEPTKRLAAGKRLREELIQVAAVCVAWLEGI